VRSENPRACFLSLQRLRTDSLNGIDFKEPGNFGPPTRWGVMASIMTHTQPSRIFTKYFRNITNDNNIHSKRKKNIPRIALGTIDANFEKFGNFVKHETQDQGITRTNIKVENEP